MEKKIIHDPIHGSISFDGVFTEIVNRHEFQRLHHIKQLGMGNMVFPGANHTRFEHCMGAYCLAGKMSSALGFSKEDDQAVRAAALLHDICHPPFSHVMEETMEEVTESNHMDLARKLIYGTVPTFMRRDADMFFGDGSISELLEKNGIDSKLVCDLIVSPVSTEENLDVIGTGQQFFSNKDCLHQIIHGPVDADQMDYLLRDAHYTGVSFGFIGLERLLSQIVIFNNTLALKKSGITAAEELMVSRALMYSSVYYHKTVRIVEKMLIKSVEFSGLDFADLYLMTDADLISRLIASSEVSSKLIRSVLNRKLYKKSYVLYSNELTEDDKIKLSKYSSREARKKLEGEIANEAGAEIYEVAADIPPKSALLSQIKTNKTDINILDNGKIRPVTRYSPVAKSLQSRSVNDWAIMISAPEELKEKVAKAARNIIGIQES